MVHIKNGSHCVDNVDDTYSHFDLHKRHDHRINIGDIYCKNDR